MYTIDPDLHERLMNMKDEDFCILVTPDAPHDCDADYQTDESDLSTSQTMKS